MVESLQKNQDIGIIIRSEIKYAIFNKTATRLNQFINKLDFNSQKHLLHYITSKNSPFSPYNCSFSYTRIKFDIIKGFEILKLLSKKKKGVTLTHEHLLLLWTKVSALLNNNLFSQLQYKDNEEVNKNNIYERISDQYAIKNNLNISMDFSNNYEYGPQGVPSQKRSRYKRRYHRK